MVATVPIAQLGSLVRGRLGLIVGPDVTLAEPSFFYRLGSHLATECGLERRGTFYEIGDRAKESGIPPEDLRKLIADFVDRETRHPALTPLATLRWSAVLSAAIDWHLETRIEQEVNRRPARREVVVVTDPRHSPGNLALPIFKLLGSTQRGDVVATTADLLRRLPVLSDICRDFVTQTKASPVLCAGFAGAPWLFEPLLAYLFSRGTALSKILFLSDDPILHSALIRELIPPSALVVAEGTLIEVARAVEPSPRNRQVNLPLPGASPQADDDPIQLDHDLFVLVPPSADATIAAEDRERLLDYLFMPDVPNFNPFHYDLDFKRSATDDLEEKLAESTGTNHRVLVLHGRAASGKTTVLKRVAFNLAKRAATVLWVRDYWHSDVSQRFQAVIRQWANAKKSQPLYFVIDDLNRLREVSMPAVLDIADKHGVKIIVLVGLRTSSYQHYDRSNITGDTQSRYDTIELADALDADEWGRLPEYLVKLGIAPDIEIAKQKARAAQGTTDTQDMLALLFFLLPQTRRQIERSVQTEYISLGDTKGLQEILIGTIRHSSRVLQEAYGMVAVSARYGIPLPIEILVAALGVGSYAEWLESVSPSGPAWGLFYPEDDEDWEGTAYRTRNDVVTQIVLRTLEGGTLTHEREVGILRRLLSVCQSTNYVYERFAERILVPNTKLQHLEFSEGLSLYDAADQALPVRNRAILHHRGLWMRNKGQNIDDALRAYDDAIAATAGPQNARVEPEEFVHASRATALIDKMDAGAISPETGRQLALAALEKSRSPTFLNAHAVDVYARLVSRLAFRHSEGAEVDRFSLINRALAEIDRTVSLIRSSRFRRGIEQRADRLLERRDEILRKCGEVRESADELWAKFGSQVGFVLETRRLMGGGVAEQDAGTQFRQAFEYWMQAKGKIELSGVELASDFAEVGLILYFMWQVHPRSRRRWRTVRDPVQWELLQKLAERSLAAERFKADPFHRFIYAVSLAHTNSWPNAKLVFDEIRRMDMSGDALHTPRCYFLHPEGVPWKLQGYIRSGANNLFFKASDLHQDFLADRSESWPRGDAIQHAYVVFSFAGPKATRSDRACVDH